MTNLEAIYPQISDSVIRKLPDSTYIIVLGGGHSDDKNLSPNNQLSTNALGRLVEGIRIHKSIHGSKLVLSGYGNRSDLTQALVLFNTGLILEVEPDNMLLSPSASNTKMEAEEFRRLFGNNKSLVIVTSAIHMPRAMKIFRQNGFDPVPAPVNHIIKQGSVKNPLRWVPSAGNIAMIESAIHEYAGKIVAYIEN